MKKQIIVLAITIFFSAVAIAQKDEMKTLKKIFERETPSAKDVIDYKAAIVAAEPLISAGTDADKNYFELYKSSLPIVETVAFANGDAKKVNDGFTKYFNLDNTLKLVDSYKSTLDFEKKSGKSTYSKNIEAAIARYKPMMIGYAVNLGNENKYAEASKILYATYELDKKDVDKLYYAAGYAVNGKDYKNALNYYNQLIALNYSGEKTVYYAKSLLNNNEDNFTNKEERDRLVKLKTHEKPRDENEPSKRGEIYKNVALLYQQDGKIDEAKRVIKEAVKLNPEDTNLALSEANLYLETKDMATYKTLVAEILAKNGNNAELLYNMGVIAYGNKQNAEAEEFYKKAIAIDPKYGNAYLNLAIIKLESEKEVIAQMNKLGNSPADNKKYDELKTKRNGIFNDSMPYLEKAVELDETNKDAAKTLLSVYKALEIMDKAKALKAKIDLQK
ncbi:MAG: hypothetical protein RLZZ312_1117 [Bacteroidota bacterium]